MKIKIIIILILIINICSCNKNEETDSTLGIFDISKDDKTILFSYKKNNVSSIYTMNVDGTNIKLIIEAKDGKSYANPRYSVDNTKILFIESKISDIKRSSLCMANADGSNIIELTNNFGIITEAFFRVNKNEIIFCKANEFNKYSPIGRKMSHSFDVYSLNTKNKQILRLTNLNAYLINHVTEIENKIAFQINSKPYNGIYTVLNKNIDIMPLIPNNETNEMYSNFLFIPEKKEIIYVNSYDLYKVNLNKRDINKEYAKFISTSNLGIISLMRKFNNSNKILCSVQNDTNLYLIDNNKFSKNMISINL